MAIQKTIDAALADRKLLRIVIREDSGAANVPENVSIDFIGCQIEKLTTAGNNRVNVEGGSVKSGDWSDTAIIIRNAEITGDVVARTNSRIEYATVTHTGKTELLDCSTLVSRHTTFNGSDAAVDASGGSTWRSTKDEFNGSQVLKATGYTTQVHIIGATSSATKLLEASDHAVVLIDDSPIQCTELGTIDQAQVEIRNSTNLTADSLFTLTNNSKWLVKKLAMLKANQAGVTASGGCSVEWTDVQDIQIPSGTAFTLDTSRLEITRFTSLNVQTLLSAAKSCAVRIANGQTCIIEQLGSMDNNGKLVVDNVEIVQLSQSALTAKHTSVEFIDVTIFSDNGTDGFNLTDCSLRCNRVQTLSANGAFVQASRTSIMLRDCSTINGGSSPFISGTDQGVVHISNCGTVSTDQGLLHLDGIWTVTLANCGTLSSGSTPLVYVSSTGGAVVTVASCNSVSSSGAITVQLVGADGFFTAATLTNNESLGCVTGRPSSSAVGQQQIQASKANIQSLDLESYSCDLFAVQFSKYKFEDCDVATRRCIQEGSWGSGDSLFSNSVLLDRISSWDGKIHAQNSTLSHWKPKAADNWVYKDAVIRVDGASKFGSVGFVPDGGSAGSTLAAAGWQVDKVEAGGGNKDAFFLSNAGSPDYSGHGAALILSGECPDIGLLNFIRINNDNIRILDSRNCYDDITNRYVRNSPTYIDDNADTYYYLSCQNAVEKATQTFKAEGTSLLMLTSSVQIVEQAPLVKEQSA